MRPSASHSLRTISMPSSKMPWLSSNETWNGSHSTQACHRAAEHNTPLPALMSSGIQFLAEAGGMSEARGEVGEGGVGGGKEARGLEVMLADPRRMHGELLGVDRLGGDVGGYLVRSPAVVVVVIVAQREVAEVHLLLPSAGIGGRVG